MIITDKELLKNYEDKKRVWQGIPSIERTKKGRFFLTFYSGNTKEAIGNYSMVIMSDDGINFTQPVIVAYKEGYRCFDPCLWIDPLGRLWFTWAINPDDGVYAAICDDPDADELKWSEPFFIAHSIMMNKPTVLSNGDWAFPVTVWDFNLVPHVTDAKLDPGYAPGTFMYVTRDCGKTFEKIGFSAIEKRAFDEHMFLEMKDGSVNVYVRTAYGIGTSKSLDGGRTWDKGGDTGYGGPDTRFHIRRLSSGRILLINHYEYTGRNNLTAMLSEDEGKTFPYRLLLDERDVVSYPDATVDENGRIYITYDRDRGCDCKSIEQAQTHHREVLIASITEQEIIDGKISSKNSYLKRVASKLTDYDGEDLYNI